MGQAIKPVIDADFAAQHQAITKVLGEKVHAFAIGNQACDGKCGLGHVVLLKWGPAGWRDGSTGALRNKRRGQGDVEYKASAASGYMPRKPLAPGARRAKMRPRPDARSDARTSRTYEVRRLGTWLAATIGGWLPEHLRSEFQGLEADGKGNNSAGPSGWAGNTQLTSDGAMDRGIGADTAWDICAKVAADGNTRGNVCSWSAVSAQHCHPVPRRPVCRSVRTAPAAGGGYVSRSMAAIRRHRSTTQ
ncbi:hypothetical protein D3C71_1497600 [compost metagenome]